MITINVALVAGIVLALFGAWFAAAMFVLVVWSPTGWAQVQAFLLGAAGIAACGLGLWLSGVVS